jgi:hypothetical protein
VKNSQRYSSIPVLYRLASLRGFIADFESKVNDHQMKFKPVSDA